MSIEVTRAVSLAVWLALATPLAQATESVYEPPAAAQAAHDVVHPDGLRSRLLRDETSPVRRLDPAIFTDLLPVTASDPALRLPADQTEAGWQGEESPAD